MQALDRGNPASRSTADLPGRARLVARFSHAPRRSAPLYGQSRRPSWRGGDLVATAVGDENVVLGCLGHRFLGPLPF